MLLFLPYLWVFMVPSFAQQVEACPYVGSYATIEVIYTLDWHRTQPAPDHLSRAAFAKADEAELVLLCNNKQAQCYMPTPFDLTDPTDILAGIVAKSSNSYYEDLETRQRIQIIHEGADINLLEGCPDIDWEISDSTTVINNMICFYATGVIQGFCGFSNTKICAWFTTDIPVPFGPAGMGGLPGLILQAKTGGISYTMKSMKNVLDKNITIEAPKKGQRFNYEAYHCRSKK